MKFQLTLVSIWLLIETPVYGQYEPSTGGNGEPTYHGGPQANPQYGPPSASNARPHARLSSQGYGKGENEAEQPANYEFQYDVSDQEVGSKFGHQEIRDGKVAQGKYYLLLPDGRTQTVEYVADQDGYRPKISYEGGEEFGRGLNRGAFAGYNRK